MALGKSHDAAMLELMKQMNNTIMDLAMRVDNLERQMAEIMAQNPKYGRKGGDRCYTM